MVVLQEISEQFHEDFTIHPLLIDHVVEKILKYTDCSPQNLLAYRGVCHLWNEIATRLYSSQNQVEIGSYSTSVPKFRKLIKLRRQSPNFDKSNKPPWPCPFVKFRLCQEVFQPIYASVVVDLFQTFHNTLESLDIWLDLRSSLLDVPIHGKAKLCTFPNLKTLVYDDRRVVLQGCKDFRGSLLKNLVELSPNLRNLSVRFQRDFRGSVECVSERVTNHIRNIFSGAQLQSSLKFLVLDMHLNDSLLNSLQTSSLRLEALEIALRGSSFSYTEFHQFLHSLRTSLRKLKLSYIERDSNCFIHFPQMTALTSLEVDGTDAFSKHSVSLGEFTYGHNFPQLHSLRISIWAASSLRWAQFFQSKIPILTIHELKLPGELCNKSMMTCVATLFPQLKKLHISVYSMTLNALEAVFERMTELEELTVTKFPSLWDRSERNIDHIFTGISESDCERIVKENVVLSRVSNDGLNVWRSRPGLTNLQKLKRLMMPDLQYQASYTDITGYLAFLKMPNLQYLNVGRSYLGNACLLALGRKYPEMEQQRKLPPAYYKEPEEDEEGSFLDLPGDTCVYL